MLVRFRLNITEKNVYELLESKPHKPYTRSFRYLFGPDYYVIAKVVNTHKIRVHEFSGSDGESKIEAEVLKGIVANGQLINVISIPKKDEMKP